MYYNLNRLRRYLPSFFNILSVLNIFNTFNIFLKIFSKSSQKFPKYLKRRQIQKQNHPSGRSPRVGKNFKDKFVSQTVYELSPFLVILENETGAGKLIVKVQYIPPQYSIQTTRYVIFFTSTREVWIIITAHLPRKLGFCNLLIVLVAFFVVIL